MNAKLCMNCKYISWINYQKWFENDKVLERVVCLRENELPQNMGGNGELCAIYDHFDGEWKECYVKEDKYKMTQEELNEKLKLNVGVKYDCPYQVEHTIFDENNK